MTGKEMKKLRREELLEMLIEQTRRKTELEARLAQAEEKLQSRELVLQEAGSLAEAALQLNAIFEAADVAAAQYLDNVKALAARQRAVNEEKDDQTRCSMERRLAETEEKCRAMEEETRQECEAMKAKARAEADAYWAELSGRLEQYLIDHEELTEWLLQRARARGREEIA